MSKFTPGPWYVFDEMRGAPGIEAADFDTSIVIWEDRDIDYDDAGVRGRTEEEAKANARLIAAAPDMYESWEPDKDGPAFLEWIAERIVCVYGESPNVDFVLSLQRMAKNAREAIAKADGNG